MYYPLNILKEEKPFPLFFEQTQGDPYVFDFSSGNPNTLKYNPNNFKTFQKQIFDELSDHHASWGIGKYLEERKNILRDYPQMIKEKRYYHLGLDIIVPGGVTLFSPYEATVFLIGVEKGVGNYGGYVILKHCIQNTVFYSFYGHLDHDHFFSVGDTIPKGTPFAKTGSTAEDTGGWFTHTHLQILTENAVQNKRIFQGYISENELKNVEEFFPTPYPLFSYS